MTSSTAIKALEANTRYFNLSQLHSLGAEALGLIREHGMPSESLWDLSVHEAGHLIAALAQGYSFGTCEVALDGGWVESSHPKWGFESIDLVDDPESGLECAAVHFSGHLAELMVVGERASHPANNMLELAQARSMVMVIAMASGREYGAVLIAATVNASSCLSANKNLLISCARTLERRKRLNKFDGRAAQSKAIKPDLMIRLSSLEQVRAPMTMAEIIREHGRTGGEYAA